MNSWPFQPLLSEAEETLFAPLHSSIGEKSFISQSSTVNILSILREIQAAL
jgi:hypothetical protein